MLPLPSGTYDGRTTGFWWRWTRFVWQGKVFTGSRVVNRIRGRRLIWGDVWAFADRVEIRYPGGLTDVLTPMPNGYDGVLRLGPVRVAFVLTKTP